MLKENHHELLRSSEQHWQEQPAAHIPWQQPPKRCFGHHALKNLAVASSLVLCAVVLRSGALPHLQPATDAVLTAVTGDTLLDDSLGKLSFVSSMFPEAVLVFGEQAQDELVLPVSGGSVVHAWSKDEPYTGFDSRSSEVYASMSGEVIGVYHGADEERLVHVLGDHGRSCFYGNLAEVHVAVGDSVTCGQLLGTVLPGMPCVWELRQDGRSVDPSAYLRGLE